MTRAGARPPAPDPLPIPVADNHAHLDIRRGDDAGFAPVLNEQVAQVLSDAAAVGVDRVIQIGCDLGSAAATVALVESHERLLGGVALHPNEAPRHAERGDLDDAFARIEEYATQPRIRVIGETGLDYYRTPPTGHGAQIESFRRHIDLAKRTGKVLQIHDREAHDDVLRVLAEEGAPECTVLHCFSGGMAMAQECVDRGYYLSFAGTVTFANARELRDALSVVPSEQLLVETDAPYLTPSPHRGAVNAPFLIPLTVRAMASVRNVSVPHLCAALSATSDRLYGPW